MALPNPLLQRLGKQLAEYRLRAGLEPEDVDASPRLGWYEGKCGRVEAGHRTATDAELHELADQYKLTEAERDHLIDLAKVARRKQRVDGVAEWARPIVLLERSAHEFDYSDESLWPALAQDEEYARDLISRGNPKDQEERIAARLARSEVLTKQDPLRVRLLLGEAALYRLPRDRASALEQLQHALDLLDVMQIRFVPFDFGLHSLLGYSCNIFRLRDPDFTQVYIEAATDSKLITDSDQAAIYVARFDELFGAVPDQSESERLLRERIQQLRTRRRHDDPEMGSA